MNIDEIEKILLADDGVDDTTLQAIGLDLLAEVKRLRYHLDLMIEKFGEAYLIETLIERGEEK